MPYRTGYPARAYAPTRILYPMQSVGKRGQGKFQRITWTQALDTIASWINDTMNTYGPLSIWEANWGSFNQTPWDGFILGHYSLNVGVGTWGAHSGSGIGIPLLMTTGRSNSTNDSIEDFFNAKLIILWGDNAACTENLMVLYYLRLAREKGIPIIHIDPRYTPTSEALADQWIAIRPGTDMAMFLAMANVLFKQNLVNTAFINQWVEPTGYQKSKIMFLETLPDPMGRFIQLLSGLPQSVACPRILSLP